MDRWAWEQLDPWLELRRTLPVGALFCVLRGPTDPRPAMRPGGDPAPVASHRVGRGSSPPVRPASTPARARCRDVTRGDPAPGHTAPARACRPRDHQRVPARDRQHRDHPRRPRAAGTNDPRRPNAPRLSPHLVSATDGGAWDRQPAPQATPPAPNARRQPSRPEFCIRRSICEVLATQHPGCANTAPANRRQSDSPSPAVWRTDAIVRIRVGGLSRLGEANHTPGGAASTRGIVWTVAAGTRARLAGASLRSGRNQHGQTQMARRAGWVASVSPADPKRSGRGPRGT